MALRGDGFPMRACVEFSRLQPLLWQQHVSSGAHMRVHDSPDVALMYVSQLPGLYCHAPVL